MEQDKLKLRLFQIRTPQGHNHWRWQEDMCCPGSPVCSSLNSLSCLRWDWNDNAFQSWSPCVPQYYWLDMNIITVHMRHAYPGTLSGRLRTYQCELLQGPLTEDWWSIRISQQEPSAMPRRWTLAGPRLASPRPVNIQYLSTTDIRS